MKIERIKAHIRAYPMIVLLLPLVAAILVWGHFSPPEQSDEEEHMYAFVLTSVAKPTPKCERFEAKVLPKGETYLYLLRDSTRAMPEYGDTVIAYTHIEREHRIGRAFAAQYTVRSARDHTLPLQYRLYKRLEAAGLEGDELATVGALTLGYKEDIDPEVKRHFQASGAAHVLAVSGLHTGIIYGFLLTLMTLGGRIRPRYENRAGRWTISLVIIAVMWFYAWLTGLTPSVVRAVIMVSLVEIGKMAYRRSPSLNTIASAAVLILLVRPTDLWSVSFQLSFAATTAIVLVARQAERFLPRKEWLQTLGGRIASWLAGIVIVSLAAQIGTLPITLYFFGQVSTYFLLTNLIVLPLASLLVPFGLVTLSLGGCLAGVWTGKVTWALAWAMNHSVGWIESLPGSTIQGHIDGWMILIYYVIIAFYSILFAYSKKKQ